MKSRVCDSRWLVFPTLAALVLASSCSRKYENGLKVVAIYVRAQVQFTNAFLLKPSGTASTAGAGYKYTPLIIQEILDTNAVVSVPDIFFFEGMATLNGQSHQQISYIWRLPPRASQPDGLQGVRMTLDSSGLPVIWEVLSDSSGADVIFVSKSIEAAARREHGPAMPERQFAVERSTMDVSRVVVARVIEDGPVPMGPIIYLRAGTFDVSTIICRCMDAQAKTLTGTAEFNLKADESRSFDGDERKDGSSLEQRLRLPHVF